MSRELLSILVPLLLPAVLYFAGVAVVRKVSAETSLPHVSWVWLLVAGVLLVALTLFVFNVHYGRLQPGSYRVAVLGGSRFAPTLSKPVALHVSVTGP